MRAPHAARRPSTSRLPTELRAVLRVTAIEVRPRPIRVLLLAGCARTLWAQTRPFPLSCRRATSASKSPRWARLIASPLRGGGVEATCGQRCAESGEVGAKSSALDVATASSSRKPTARNITRSRSAPRWTRGRGAKSRASPRERPNRVLTSGLFRLNGTSFFVVFGLGGGGG